MCREEILGDGVTEARSLIHHLDALAVENLATYPVLDKVTDKIHKQIIEKIHEYFDELVEVLEPLKKENSECHQEAFRLVRNLMLLSASTGTSAVFSSGAKKIQGRARAANARKKRAINEGPREAAIRESIINELGNIKRSTPSKDSVWLLDGVNRRLVDLGHDPIKKDVIRRRLENGAL